MEAGYVDLASCRVTDQAMAVFALPAWRHSIEAASLLISQTRVTFKSGATELMALLPRFPVRFGKCSGDEADV